MTTQYRVFLGWDASEKTAWVVARQSIGATTTSGQVDASRLDMHELSTRGLYYRPTLGWPERKEPGYWDAISDAPMATGHAIARFLVPFLCHYEGWALFTDGDVLFRDDVGLLFALADPRHAVSVVQHCHVPTGVMKMEGQIQTSYARKNWSSVMLFNCAHPSNRALNVELVNTVPGRDLHRFCWLRDDEIGALPARWNYLVGASPRDDNPAIVHFTSGVPNMPGYEHVEFSDEWYSYAARSGCKLVRPLKPDYVATSLDQALLTIESLAAQLQATLGLPPEMIMKTRAESHALALRALSFVAETRATTLAATP